MGLSGETSPRQLHSVIVTLGNTPLLVESMLLGTLMLPPPRESQCGPIIQFVQRH